MNKEQHLRKHSLLILFRMILAACLITVMPMIVVASNPLVLHESVRRDDNSALETAIKEGASINKQDSNGWNALMYAAKGGNVDALSMLLQAGALPDINDRLGRTPLHLASAAPAEISSSLIQAGTNVNSRNAGGVTALMLAAGGGRRDIVELLLAAGARMDLKDYQGSSVVKWSRRSSDQAFTKELNPSLSPYISNSIDNNGLKIFLIRYGTTFVLFWRDNGLHRLAGIPCEFQCAQQDLL